MKIYVVRHGQTDLNLQKRMQGRSGLPLNKTGIEQVEQTARELENVKFDLVFSSPQERAIQTAQIVSRQKSVIVDARLDAFDVGEADNQVIDEKMKLLYGLVPDSSVYDGVEDTTQFANRIVSFLDELLQKHKSNSVNVLIAGHKCTTGMIEAYFTKMPSNGDFFSMSTKNGKYRLYCVE